MMANELSQSISANNLDCIQYFKKCGEIIATPDFCFGLNCLFCPGVCMEMDIFIEHIREAHSDDIRVLYGEREQQIAAQPEQQSKQIAIIATDMLVEEDQIADKILYSNSNNNCSTNDDDDDDGNSNRNSNSNSNSRHYAENKGGICCVSDGVVESAIIEVTTASAPQEEVDSVYIVEEDLIHEQLADESIDPFNVIHAASAAGAVNRRTTRSVTRARLSKESRFAAEQEVGAQTDGESAHGSVLRPSTRRQAKGLAGSEQDAARMDERTSSPRRRTTTMGHSKEIVSYLLDAYRANEKLWNPMHPHYKYNARRKIFDELASPLQRDMNYTLSGSEIFTIINRLRSRFRRELTKLRKSKGAYKSNLWYFKKMDFLRAAIEHRRANREAKCLLELTEEEERTIPTNEMPVRFLPNREVLTCLLNAYKGEECLWNPKHPAYSNCRKHSKFTGISNKLLDELNISMTAQECYMEMQKLRTRYRKELIMMSKCKGSFEPKLWCFDELAFLKAIMLEQIENRQNNQTIRLKARRKKEEQQEVKAKSIAFENIDEQLRFAELYRNYPALWNVEHPDYRSATYRQDALKQMQHEFAQQFHHKPTLDELNATLYRLRKEYSVEKLRALSQAIDTPSMLYTKLSEYLESHVGPFRCDICDVFIKTSDQYKLHKSSHDGTLPFLCALCGKGFHMPGNLSIHIRRHKHDFPYACQLCEKRFATCTELATHSRTHTNERPYICDICGKSFKTWSFFDIHRRGHLKDSNFHCPICDKQFYERHRFTDHMNGHLNIRKHSCNVCGKSFTTTANLRKHCEIHLPVKKYKCSNCGKRFAQQASLRWHKTKCLTMPFEQEPVEQ